jgi:LuxR family transcriptional regulator, maltose regulon positive regulatory protein
LDTVLELRNSIHTRESSGLWPRCAVSLDYVKQLLQALDVMPEEELPPKEILTEQEMRILLLISSGLSNKEIAHRLNITNETVKSHIKNVYRKLRVNNRVQALHCAKDLKIMA